MLVKNIKRQKCFLVAFYIALLLVAISHRSHSLLEGRPLLAEASSNQVDAFLTQKLQVVQQDSHKGPYLTISSTCNYCPYRLTVLR